VRKSAGSIDRRSRLDALRRVAVGLERGMHCSKLRFTDCETQTERARNNRFTAPVIAKLVFDRRRRADGRDKEANRLQMFRIMSARADMQATVIR
jgi:hypothetical protein